jgi:hypothetical protein
MRLWDTQRGRAGAFWQVDIENIWITNAIDASGNFVDIDPINTFAEFQKELGPADNGHLGLIFEDGTSIVRKVSNITEVSGSWRCTVTPSMPTSLDFTKVHQVGRARKVRFFEDELREEWVTAETVEMQFSTQELLNEQEAVIS